MPTRRRPVPVDGGYFVAVRPFDQSSLFPPQQQHWRFGRLRRRRMLFFGSQVSALAQEGLARPSGRRETIAGEDVNERPGVRRPDDNGDRNGRG